ncbi:MAG: site-specific tyrosine recombinase XerD [Propionibacteriaceae bacterium]|nr:site-specific tyrosine recombinase XerD [Propionibacteriaceae bacterium]
MTNALDREIAVYLDHLKAERGLSTHTIAAYSRDLARYAEYLRAAGITEPCAIDRIAAAGFPIQLAAQGLAASSVGRMTVAVRGLHRFWADEGITAINPAQMINPAAPGRRLPKALTIDQVEALIEATGGRHPGAPPDQIRDWALVEVLYGTGARISEVLDLDVEDVIRMLADETMGLKFTGKGNKQRILPVGRFAREAMQEWLVRGRPAVLASRATSAFFLNIRGGRLSRQSAFNRILALGHKAAITQEISPHTLRHSYATHLIDGGADVRVVQELLGHSSVATTQIYTLITVDHLREVYRVSHPRAVE